MKQFKVIITRYENDDDDIGVNEYLFVDINYTVKDLIRYLGKKYKANQKEFFFSDDVNLNKELTRFGELNGYFNTRKDESIDIYCSKNAQ